MVGVGAGGVGGGCGEDVVVVGVADGEVVDGGGASGGLDGEDGDGLAVSGRDGIGAGGVGVGSVVVGVVGVGGGVGCFESVAFSQVGGGGPSASLDVEGVGAGGGDGPGGGGDLQGGHVVVDVGGLDLGLGACSMVCVSPDGRTDAD